MSRIRNDPHCGEGPSVVPHRACTARRHAPRRRGRRFPDRWPPPRARHGGAAQVDPILAPSQGGGRRDEGVGCRRGPDRLPAKQGSGDPGDVSVVVAAPGRCAGWGPSVRFDACPCRRSRSLYTLGGYGEAVDASSEAGHRPSWATGRRAGVGGVMGWLWHALAIAGSMTWEILWALILGFALSAVVQAVVRRESVVRALGDDSPRALAAATGLGMASSSCSSAAVALARAVFRKGASFTAAMVFEIASTNLVIELGIILALLISWQFTLAEFIGGPIMIVLVAVAFRLFVRQRLIDAAREQADKGLAGSMEGHAAMDMSIQADGSFRRRLLSREGYTSVSNIFVMEWAAVIRDVVIGLLIAGAVAAWVPDTFWQ